MGAAARNGTLVKSEGRRAERRAAERAERKAQERAIELFRRAENRRRKIKNNQEESK